MFDLKFRFFVLPVVWLMLACCCSSLWAQQLVFIDFNSATSGGEHFYTTSERAQILEELERDYARFFVFFTQLEPTRGDFSTVTLNAGEPFGLAEAIDFRNLDRNDTATVDVNSGATTSAEFVTLTTSIVSHELGHLLGLRHGDSFGPIGSGIDINTIAASDYNPTYPGPRAAVETRVHIMETDSIFIEDRVPQFFSERSAIRLTFNEIGTVISEARGTKGTLATAQEIELVNMPVPNTLESGDNADPRDFDVDALAVVGSLSVNGQNDFYRIEANGGDLLNIEVISEAISERIADTIDPQVTVLDADGNAIDYFGTPAFNDDEFETFDAILIDLELPSDGIYYIQINAFSANDTGSYELFVNRFNGLVEPDLKGDFDDDNDVDVDDIDFYIPAIGLAGTGQLAELDLNNDGQITLDDFELHVTECVQTSNGQTGTFLGDLNLDGQVNVVEDGFILISDLGNAASSYGQGDLNLDGEVSVLEDAFIFVANLDNSNDP